MGGERNGGRPLRPVGDMGFYIGRRRKGGNEPGVRLNEEGRARKGKGQRQTVQSGESGRGGVPGKNIVRCRSVRQGTLG